MQIDARSGKIDAPASYAQRCPPVALSRFPMRARAGIRNFGAAAACISAACLTPGLALAQPPAEQRQASLAEPSAAHVRWKESLAAFAAADRERAPAPEGVLFVGSSSIRMWNDLAQDFRDQPIVINRGFGGSTMADCQAFVSELVLRYRPRQVLVYAGDNDLAEGRTPAQVLESFQKFVQQVRAELPQTHIAYISIKPSPSRAALLPKVREANGLIASHVATLPQAQYIDIFTPMLDATGQPRGELFRADALHLNESGYRLWQSVIANHLAAPGASAQAIASRLPAKQ